MGRSQNVSRVIDRRLDMYPHLTFDRCHDLIHDLIIDTKPELILDLILDRITDPRHDLIQALSPDEVTDLPRDMIIKILHHRSHGKTRALIPHWLDISFIQDLIDGLILDPFISH